MNNTKQTFAWNKVTPLSKYLAMVLFIALPFIGFMLGMKYQQMNTFIKEGNISQSPAPTTPSTSPTNSVGLANPAAVYCKEQGGENEIITAADGSQSGQCVFSDGRKCDDWQFFRTHSCK